MGRTLERWPPAAMSYKRAIEAMRRAGARLIKQSEHRSPNGAAYYVNPAPGGSSGYVEPDTAKKIMDHPCVVRGHDGMWPGMDQTWRMNFSGG